MRAQGATQAQQMKAQSNRKVETFMNDHPELRTDETLRTEVYEVLKAMNILIWHRDTGL